MKKCTFRTIISFVLAILLTMMIAQTASAQTAKFDQNDGELEFYIPGLSLADIRKVILFDSGNATLTSIPTTALSRIKSA